MDDAERAQRLGNLTEAQQKVFALLCEGNTYEDIAKRLFISTNTVSFHRKGIYTELDLSYLSTRERRAERDRYCRLLSELASAGQAPPPRPNTLPVPIYSFEAEEAAKRAVTEDEVEEGEILIADGDDSTYPTGGGQLAGPVVPIPIPPRGPNPLVIALVITVVVLAAGLGYLLGNRQPPVTVIQALPTATPDLTQQARIDAAAAFVATAQAAPTAVPTATPDPIQQALAATAIAFQATAQAAPTSAPSPTPAAVVTPIATPISATSLPAATPLRTPTAAPVSQSNNLLYEADWSQGADNWPVSGQWKWSQGHLLADGTATDSITAPYPAPVSDYAVEATIRVLPAGGSSNPFGLIARSALTAPSSNSRIGYAAGVYCQCPMRTTILRGTVNNKTDRLDANDFDPGTRPHSYRFELSGYTLSLLVDNNPRTVSFDIVFWPRLILGNGPPVVRARPTLPTSNGRLEVGCAGEERRWICSRSYAANTSSG